MLRGLIGAVVIAALVACAPPPRADSPPARRAFYYWRTTFKLSAVEQQALADLHVDRLYVRMFDVEWHDGAGPTPVGMIAAGDGARVPDGIEGIPVVYLRNEVFAHLPAAGRAELARTVWRDVQQRAQTLGFRPRELQLDCDWTDSTRDGFFAFLRELRAVTAGDAIALSATIRLHQVKYRERTGVPPVDRGMLMFYNMGAFSPDPRDRAIFDPVQARRYLGRLASYPLPLDAALPIWSWTLHLRDGQVEGLLQSTDPDELAGLDFVQRTAPDRSQGHFVVRRTAFLHGTLLRAGDELKAEVTGPAEAQAAAGMLASHLARTAQPRTVSLFDLSERNLTRHGTEKLERLFGSVR